jgi:hypothetical protein
MGAFPAARGRQIGLPTLLLGEAILFFTLEREREFQRHRREACGRGYEIPPETRAFSLESRNNCPLSPTLGQVLLPRPQNSPDQLPVT